MRRTRNCCSTRRRQSRGHDRAVPHRHWLCGHAGAWLVPPDLPLTPHEHEVADWFEAPLGFVFDPANQHCRSALFQGQTRHYYEILWEGRRIWGATAGMFVNLSRRLQWN